MPNNRGDGTIPKPDDLTTRIVRHVSRKDYRPQGMGPLARSLGVESEGYPAFRDAVKALMHSGRVVRGGGNSIMLPDVAVQIIGTFRGHAKGFGFVVPESPTDHGDLFIPPGSSGDAITGDTVRARITRRGKGGDQTRVEGEIIEVLERAQNRFVGELARQDNQWLLIPDGHALHAPVLLGDVGAKRAKPGDQIVVELTTFPSPDQPGRGVIVEVLGRRGDPGIDIISIVRQYHLPEAFPEEVLDDARRAIRANDLKRELARREDLRAEVVVTIDPDDAKDYDDAISIRRVARGRFELGVHIADVSALVKPGGPLDAEASHRGNSVYFPGHVIPMLPEVLSNGLCSLQEAEPRLTKSVFIEYDNKGHRKAKRYANTVIQSNKRLTYRQATQIAEGDASGYAPEVVGLVREMDHLARAIQKRRLDQGMIVLELPEIDIVLDDDGRMIGVEPEDTSFSHTIIEMFMVEANEAVAELFSSLAVPHLRRIHPEPPGDAQQKLSRFLRVLGKPVPKKLEREDMLRLLAGVRGKPESFAVNLAVLRSMAQAEYSPKEIGHFALASTHYSHFTSPIRRYPDLVVHRLLQMYLNGELKSRGDRSSAPSKETLEEIGRRCSFTERHAESAERELRQVKVLRFLEGRIGDVEPGIVTGVTNVGIFVQLRHFLIDGLIRFDDLPDDWWDIDPRAGCVVGQRTRRRIAIGDALEVQIAAVDIAGRELDLILSDRARHTMGKPSPDASKGKPHRSAGGPPSRHRRAGGGPRSRERSSRRSK